MKSSWLRNALRAVVFPVAAATLLLLTRSGSATVINVTTNDNYSKIEAAKAGDEVIIAPGTYKFRVYLTSVAPASNPINIHALDPNNKPVWDFGSTLAENAPGSYTAGDRGRGGWQISGGANYHISGITFANCHTASANSAGMRYYESATGIYFKDCVFHDNDNGITGGSQNSDITVEFSEFYHNGIWPPPRRRTICTSMAGRSRCVIVTSTIVCRRRIFTFAPAIRHSNTTGLPAQKITKAT